jgi:hypothetical protein
MKFDDQQFALINDLGKIDVTITGDAIHVLWGKGAGPQTASELICANTDMLNTIATQKFENDDVTPDGYVVITDLDIEG